MKKMMKKFIATFLVVAIILCSAPLSDLVGIDLPEWINFSVKSKANSIPNDAVEFNGNYYKYYYNKVTWDTAKSLCEQAGGHLVTISNEDENAFVANLIMTANRGGAMIGLTDSNQEGVFQWVTGEPLEYTNWANGEPNNQGNEDYVGMGAKWNDGHFNRENWDYVCEWDFDMYNHGEETYSFENYVDDDSNGHCFGMSITSSGYYLNLLDIAAVGGNKNDDVNGLLESDAVKAPICHYQDLQGSSKNNSIVAGGTYFKTYKWSHWAMKYVYETNISKDWQEVVNYVRNLDYDNSGSLVVLYGGEQLWSDGSVHESTHAINFLYYKEVDGQQRIYASDNNFLDTETYFYLDENGNVCQAPRATYNKSICSISLMDVETYFNSLKNDKKINYIYADSNSVTVVGAEAYPMAEGDGITGRVMYKIPDSTNQVIVKPLVENAKFEYNEDEYTFDEIVENTYGVLSFEQNEEDTDTTKFEILCCSQNHNFVDGVCADCGQRTIRLEEMSSQIRFDTNEDGSYAGTFDVRTRAKILDEDFNALIGSTNAEAQENIDSIGFVYTLNGENFSAESAQAVAQGKTVVGYVNAPVKSIQDCDGYYMFTCLVTDIPESDTNYTLTAYAYICVNGKWYFATAPNNADFNLLYSKYYPLACEKYGW